MQSNCCYHTLLVTMSNATTFENRSAVSNKVKPIYCMTRDTTFRYFSQRKINLCWHKNMYMNVDKTLFVKVKTLLEVSNSIIC